MLIFVDQMARTLAGNNTVKKPSIDLIPKFDLEQYSNDAAAKSTPFP